MASGKEDDNVQQPSGADTKSLETTLLLEKIYHGKTPGSLRGPKALFDQAKADGFAKVRLKDCINYLRSQPTYTLYKPRRVRFPHNPIVANFCGEIVQIDIMDLNVFKTYNDNYRYVLLSYDTYSKYLVGYPMITKKPEPILAGLVDLQQRLPFPICNIYWDKEGSFHGRVVQKWLTEQGIKNYTTKSAIKAPGVERAIRSVRLALQRYFQSSSTFRWLEQLQVFTDNYNNRMHSSTKLKPLDLATDPMLTVSPKHDPTPVAYKLPPVGAYVRLNRDRSVFDKEASGTWTTEVFRIVRHNISQPIPLTVLHDLTDKPIAGSFYPEEYQVIDWHGKKLIKSVLRKRLSQGRQEQLVTYDGWPSSFTQWIPVSD